MITRNAVVISISLVLLLVSVALIIVSKTDVTPNNGAPQPDSIAETGSTYVSSPAFESFLIRSDETPESSTRPIRFGKRLFEMQSSGEIIEIAIPDNKGVLSAQYSPNRKNIAISFCEFEGKKLCGIYVYNLETQELTHLTKDEPKSDYESPVWISDEEIAYLFNVAGVNESQKFVPFRASLSNPYERTLIGTEAEYECLYLDANESGEVVVGCRENAEGMATVVHYNREGKEVAAYSAEGLLTGVEITNERDVYALISSSQTNNTTGLVSLEENRVVKERVRSISMLSSDVYAYTEAPFENYFIVSDMNNRELILSPGRVLLDSK